MAGGDFRRLFSLFWCCLRKRWQIRLCRIDALSALAVRFEMRSACQLQGLVENDGVFCGHGAYNRVG